MSKRIILVVDDDPLIVGFVERALQRAGYETLSASDGAGALRTIAGRQVDCVVTDIIMPQGLGGAELFVALRQTSPNLPIVVMSGHASLESEAFHRLAVQFGVREMLHKPFGPEELLAAVERASGGAGLDAELS